MNHRRYSANLGASLLALAGGLAAVPAWGQSAEPQASADPRSLEIVVTAQKREQQLVDVPISIAALGSDQIENNQIPTNPAVIENSAGDWYGKIALS